MTDGEPMALAAPVADATGMGVSGSVIAWRALSAGAAALICWAFFLPWMNGDGPFDLRSFSGFDFARLVRNFEITTDTQSSLAQVRASAIALYLVPALAVNAAAIHLAAPMLALPARYAGWALMIAAVYAGAMLLLVLTFSLVPLNDLAEALGSPRAGFALTGVGVGALSLAGRREFELERRACALSTVRPEDRPHGAEQ
jgi:hypothetical protein